MSAFSRIFKYVWPQWGRLIAILISVMIIAVLFAGSFATVIPLLKVMMGRESIHRWIDREICEWRYEISFYVPEAIDLDTTNSIDKAKNILITDVKIDKKAYRAGIRREDKILAILPDDISDTKRITGRGNILSELANAPDNASIRIILESPNANGSSNPEKTVILSTGVTDETTKIKMGVAKWAAGFVPANQGINAKQQAVIWIIILMGVITVIRCIARFYQQYLAEKVVEVSVAKLREEAFSHAMEMPVGFFVKEGSSDTVSRLIGDINGTGNGIKILLGKALREPAKAIACLTAAMLISWQLMLIFLGCAPFTIGLASILGKKMKKIHQTNARQQSDYAGKAGRSDKRFTRRKSVQPTGK